MADPRPFVVVPEAVRVDTAATTKGIREDGATLEAESRAAVRAHHFVALLVLRILFG
jgi:hypothetical protein